jgi:hypothetical protein
MQLINDCTLLENLQLFGLQHKTPTAEYSNVESSGKKASLDTQEKLAQFLLCVMAITAGSTRMSSFY